MHIHTLYTLGDKNMFKFFKDLMKAFEEARLSEAEDLTWRHVTGIRPSVRNL